jgi:hypothetical protein
MSTGEVLYALFGGKLEKGQWVRVLLREIDNWFSIFPLRGLYYITNGQPYNLLSTPGQLLNRYLATQL